MVVISRYTIKRRLEIDWSRKIYGRRLPKKGKSAKIRGAKRQDGYLARALRVLYENDYERYRRRLLYYFGQLPLGLQGML